MESVYKAAYIYRQRRDMNDSTTLSARECRCTHGYTERESVGGGARNGWREWREGHSAEVNTRVAEGTVVN